MHLYAFGSICRGQIDLLSDIDLLALIEPSNKHEYQPNPKDYSIYSYSRINELWKQGNPFAWHLHLESKLIYSPDGSDFLKALGRPNEYQNGIDDCQKFYEIFKFSRKSLEDTPYSEIFDLSSIFLSIRNIATCFSLATNIHTDFSRSSALNLCHNSLTIEASVFHQLERARMLCTRGSGEILSSKEILQAKESLDEIESWMIHLIKTISKEYLHERV